VKLWLILLRELIGMRALEEADGLVNEGGMMRTRNDQNNESAYGDFSIALKDDIGCVW
jgi:hypothetical protein